MRAEWCKYNCGDRVYDRIDPRHIGTVRAINGPLAVVVWENRMESELALWRLRHETGKR
jgi:hypothetical protein